MAASVTRTAIRLADGRELIYFDEQPGIDRSQPDRRDLDATRTASEIRYDVLVDQWVVIASHRQTRTHLPPRPSVRCARRRRHGRPRSPQPTTTWWCSRTASRR